MALLCKQCGKKSNILFGDPYYLDDSKILCCNCARHIRKEMNDLYNVKNQEDFELLKDKIISKCEQYYDDSIMPYILAKIDKAWAYTFSDDIVYDIPKNNDIGPFENQDLVYKIDGVRGRHIDIYTDKVVITTTVTLGSLLTHNATDGEKTIYYSDCIGVQFKQSQFAIGYLQLETASSNGNNISSNFFAENSFTFDTTVISNERTIEVANYVKSRVDAVKKAKIAPATTNNNSVSVADELLKLKQLFDMGVLTQEEFDKQKNKLLNT